MVKITGQNLLDFNRPSVVVLQALLNGLQVKVKCFGMTYDYVWETGPHSTDKKLCSIANGSIVDTFGTYELSCFVDFLDRADEITISNRS